MRNLFGDRRAIRASTVVLIEERGVGRAAALVSRDIPKMVLATTSASFARVVPGPCRTVVACTRQKCASGIRSNALVHAAFLGGGACDARWRQPAPLRSVVSEAEGKVRRARCRIGP